MGEEKFARTKDRKRYASQRKIMRGTGRQSRAFGGRKRS
jgi:hypothetical protein